MILEKGEEILKYIEATDDEQNDSSPGNGPSREDAPVVHTSTAEEEDRTAITSLCDKLERLRLRNENNNELSTASSRRRKHPPRNRYLSKQSNNQQRRNSAITTSVTSDGSSHRRRSRRDSGVPKQQQRPSCGASGSAGRMKLPSFRRSKSNAGNGNKGRRSSRRDSGGKQPKGSSSRNGLMSSMKLPSFRRHKSKTGGTGEISRSRRNSSLGKIASFRRGNHGKLSHGSSSGRWSTGKSSEQQQKWLTGSDYSNNSENSGNGTNDGGGGCDGPVLRPYRQVSSPGFFISEEEKQRSTELAFVDPEDEEVE